MDCVEKYILQKKKRRGRHQSDVIVRKMYQLKRVSHIAQAIMVKKTRRKLTMIWSFFL